MENTPTHSENLQVVVLVPCYNEAAAIGTVIRDFRLHLPEARICVFDNNSTDNTVATALEHGAEVFHERRQGKGNVVRRMFAEVEADFYFMVDGDATYDAASAPKMLQKMLAEHLDMVVARRVSTEQLAYRAGHRTGNRMLTNAVGYVFGQQMTDILSGYRVFSKRFLKSFPATATGFETETELTVHALQMRLPVAEVDTPYFARPEGSVSKLSTWSDGIRIMVKILRLFSLEKPLRFFSIIALLCGFASSLLFLPVLIEYFETGLVPRVPSLIVAVGGYLAMGMSLMVGVILRTTAAARLESKRLAYLAVRQRW
jgi:glycosyltransferase involved in cell wall biosynthesis